MGGTLQSSLPCNHPPLHVPYSSSLTTSSTQYKFNLFPPNLNFLPAIARNHALKQSTSSTQNKSISNSVATLQIPKGCTTSPIFRTDNDVADYSLTFLRLFIMRKSCYFHDFRQFHGHFLKSGALGSSSLIQNKLAIMYSKSEESLEDARMLFDEIPEKTVPAYASLMGSYCRSERWIQMFEVFSLMVDDGILPDKYLVPTILKACTAMKLLRTGKMVHGFTIRKEVWRDLFVGNALIDLYANSGDLTFSRNVFDTLQERDVVSWTALVSAYMDGGFLEEATNIFNSMEINGVTPDLISWNTLISGFARNGEIDLAFQSLEEMQDKGVKLQVSSWNGVISGCVQNGLFENAFDVLHKMLSFPENPNVVTLASILPACAGIKNPNLGRAIHGYAVKCKLLKNIHVEGSLFDMYTKCGRNDYAEKVFVEVEKKNTALWNEMIAAYVNEGKMDDALELLKLMHNEGLNPDEITYNTILSGYARHGKKNEAYEILSKMKERGLKPNIVSHNILISGFQQYGLSCEALNFFRNVQSPNPVTITSVLAACADLSLLNRGKEVHGYIVKSGFESNIFVSSALVDMYAKCNDMSKATEIFWNIKGKNTVSWNSLIAGHVKNEHPEEGLKLFNAMLSKCVRPTSITFMILLPVCGDIKALSMGRALHGYIVKRSGDIEIDHDLVNVLVDMYAKCGCLEDAKLVVDSNITKNIDAKCSHPV